MVESFRVNAVLNFTSNAPQVLQQLGREFSQFDRVIKDGQANLKAFETTLRGIGSSRNLGGLVKNLEQLGRIRIGNIQGLASLGQATMAIERLNAAGGKGIGQLVRSLEQLGKINLGGAPSEINTLVRLLDNIVNVQSRVLTGARAIGIAWKDTAEAMREGAAALRGVRTTPPSPGGGRGRAVTPGVITPQERQRERDWGGAGMVAGMASNAIENVLKNTFGASFSVSEAKSRLMLGGFDKRESEEAETKAYRVQQSGDAMGSTVLGNLDIIRDLNAVFHSAADSMKMMPDMAAMGVVLGKVGKGDQITELFQAAQAGELRGLNKPGSEELDTDKFGAFLHKLEMVSVGTGGRVGPTDYLNFLRQARGAGARLSDEALFTSMPAAMMALRSNRAGTSLQSWSQSEFGHLAAGYAAEQEKMGLIAPGGYTKSKSGSTLMKPGAVYHEDIMQSDPVSYILDWLVPQLRKKLDPTGKLAESDPKALQGEIIRKLITLYPRNTITGAVEEIAINPAMMRRAMEAFKAGGKLDSMDYNQTLKDNDAQLHLDAFKASWTALITAFGEASGSNAVAILDKLTNAMNSLSSWARANPDMADKIVGVATALGVLAAAISALSLASIALGPGGRILKGLAVAGGGGGAAAVAAEAAGAGGLAAGVFGITPAAGAGILLGMGAAAGAMNAPMLDDYGRVVGNWGGPEGEKNWNGGAAPGGSANNNQPGSSAANPVYNIQINQPSARDLANGVSDNQARSLGAGPRSGTGFDPTIGPAFSYVGTP